MNVQLNIPNVTVAIVATAITVATVSGSIQGVIPFADPLNEMAFAFFTGISEPLWSKPPFFPALELSDG